MTDELDYPTRHARAKEWTRRAEHHLVTYTWRPTDKEREIVDDVDRAGRSPVPSMPPFTDEPVWFRLARLSSWAPAIRLGMRAGKWKLPKQGIGAPPTGGKAITLADLLSGIYLVAEILEEWDRKDWYRSAPISDEEHAQHMADEIPGFADHLADAERFFGGIGGIGTGLIAAIVTGNVEY